ncbi:MAG: Gfo/Idh/MocA family protein [Limnochordia bacterium]|jgi:predicted dehydrogenase
MLKIGQIGIAHDHASGKMSCVRKFPGVFEVVGVAEEDPDTLKRLGKQACYRGVPVMSIDELLSVPGLDAVMVETDELSLVHAAQRCIDQGIHVHIDKPPGASVEEYERLLSEAKRKNLIVQLAYMYRYNPAVQYCWRAVKSGKLGEIFRVQAIMNTYHPPEKRAWMKPFPGGNMFYLGCHMVDLAVMMMGAPDRILPFAKSTFFDGVDVADTALAVFEYERGIATVEACSNDVNGYGRRSLLVCGSKGTLEIRPLEGDYNGQPTLMLSLKEMTEGREYTDCKAVIPLPPMTGRYDAMMLDFARMITEGRENPFSYEYELLVHKAVLAACGMPIDVTYTEV